MDMPETNKDNKSPQTKTDSNSDSIMLNTIPDNQPIVQINSDESNLTLKLNQIQQHYNEEIQNIKMQIENIQLDYDSKINELKRELTLKDKEIELLNRENQLLKDINCKQTVSGMETKNITESSSYEPMNIMMESIKTLLEQSRIQQQAIINSIYTPRIELPTFDGDPLKYYPFLCTFQHTVDSKITDDSVKLDILVQHCSNEVRNLLQCCLIKKPTEGFALAKQLLKDRYGDPERIATAWMERLLQRPSIKNIKDLQTYANDLKTCCETLKSLDHMNELDSITNLRILAQKLPDEVYTRWVIKNYSIRETEYRHGNLIELLAFIDRIVEETHNATFPPRYDEFHDATLNTNSSKVNISHHQTHHGHCPACNDNHHHHLNQCASFRNMSVNQRQEFINDLNLCHNCFQPHPTENCHRNWKCDINGCGERHNRWLHPVNYNNSNKLRNPKGIASFKSTNIKRQRSNI